MGDLDHADIVSRSFRCYFGRSMPAHQELGTLFGTGGEYIAYMKKVLCFTKAVIEPLERRGMSAADSIVDLASGDGQMSLALFLRGYRRVTLYDLDAQRQEFARRVVRAFMGAAVPVSVIRASALELQQEFDVLICYQTIEHLSTEGNYAVASRACQRQFLSAVNRHIGKLAYFNAPNRLYPRDKHDTNRWFFHWLPISLRRRLISSGWATSSWSGIAEPVSTGFLGRHLRHFRLATRYHSFDDPVAYMASYPPFDYMGTPVPQYDLDALPIRKRLIVAGSRMLGYHAQNLLPVLSLIYSRVRPRPAGSGT